MKGDYLRTNVRLICSAFKEKAASYLFTHFHLFDLKSPQMDICGHLMVYFQTYDAAVLSSINVEVHIVSSSVTCSLDERPLKMNKQQVNVTVS